MTSSISLKRIISLGAAALLAIGGSFLSAAPAQALAGDKSSVTLAGGNAHIQPSMTSISIDVTGCGSISGTPNLSDFVLTINSTVTAPASISATSYIVLGLSNPIAAGDTLSLSYTQNGSRLLTCGLGGQIGTFTFTDTAVVVMAPGGTVTANPATPTFSNGQFTATAASWSNATINKRGYWVLCTSSHTATNGINPGTPRPADCMPFSATALSAQPTPTWLNTNPLTLSSTANKLVSCLNNCTTSVVQTAGAFLSWYEVDNGTWTMSTTIAVDGSGASVSVTPAPLSAVQARNVLKPLPLAVQPLVPALTAFTKPLSIAGGKIDAKAGDFTGLISATIAGKSLEFKLPTTGGISLVVPNGEAGKTADLLLTFTTGPIIFQDAIKYVAPLVVADVPVRPVAIKAGAKVLTESAADDVRHAALANMKNNSIQCVGYAATDSAKAAAKATAAKACGLAVATNPELVNVEVTVEVNKAKAATEGVGIRVFKN